MIVCELEFEREDPEKLGYSLVEVDYYAHLPFVSVKRFGVESHRLSLRKNLITGQYEVYRDYHFTLAREEVLTSTDDLQEAIDYATREWNYYWGHIGTKERDKVCQHTGREIAFLCPLRHER